MCLFVPGVYVIKIIIIALPNFVSPYFHRILCQVLNLFIHSDILYEYENTLNVGPIIILS